MLLTAFTRRLTKQRTFAALLLLAVGLTYILLRTPSRHELQPDLFDPGAFGTSRIHISQAAKQLCRKHGFSPHKQDLFKHDRIRRKVYDLFLFSTELDWLDIRMNTLYSVVDYFVIVESSKTFTGLPKPLLLREHWSNFTFFHEKMLYYVVDDEIESARTWDHEDFFRNALLYNTVPHMQGFARQPNYGDVLVVSDIDELPRPETMTLLRYCDFPKRLTLRSQFFYYSFQWLHRGEQWAHPQATVFRGLSNTISPKDLRNGEGGPGWRLLQPLRRWWQKADLWNAAWHCSSCFSTISEMQTKMSSFSHTPWNTEENRDPRTIVARVRNGTDLFGRGGELYDKVESSLDAPNYVLKHNDRFGYLTNRDDQKAAFLDYGFIP